MIKETKNKNGWQKNYAAMIGLAERKLHLHVSNEELAQRKAAWQKPTPAATRGYVSMYIKHVMGADKGADMDFLQGHSGSVVTRDSH